MKRQKREIYRIGNSWRRVKQVWNLLHFLASSSFRNGFRKMGPTIVSPSSLYEFTNANRFELFLPNSYSEFFFFLVEQSRPPLMLSFLGLILNSQNLARRGFPCAFITSTALIILLLIMETVEAEAVLFQVSCQVTGSFAVEGEILDGIITSSRGEVKRICSEHATSSIVTPSNEFSSP
ncbi:hypothetical protein KIW84_030249 [Lathyrus oleraceus]|uniref:Uncharacterized protein n=1 Tax=Pisum sativum TaxID=3888 RepID=A0A9D5ATN1_PEA|nr:hypothetical protein KIW84_030247 [Pisum sativum]KAI5423954.1 hypothetical protein KIW84_030249 [Pisum sativum]